MNQKDEIDSPESFSRERKRDREASGWCVLCVSAPKRSTKTQNWKRISYLVGRRRQITNAFLTLINYILS